MEAEREGSGADGEGAGDKRVPALRLESEGAAGSGRRSGCPFDSKEALQAENERLRQELARITEQRDILKKAAGILSEPSHSGMPGLKR